jgi:hypothetical protein
MIITTSEKGSWGSMRLPVDGEMHVRNGMHSQHPGEELGGRDLREKKNMHGTLKRYT